MRISDWSSDVCSSDLALADYLRRERIDLLVDATHPFAARITDNAEAACRLSGTPRLLVERPPWQAVAGDDWILVPDAEAAAGALDRKSVVVGKSVSVRVDHGGSPIITKKKIIRE